MQKLIQEALATKRESLLRKREVLRITGLSNSTFYNRIKEGVIPQGVPIGPRMKGWPESEIDLFVRSCIEARDNSAKLIDARGTTHVEKPSRAVASITKKHAQSSVSADTLETGKGIGVAHSGEPVRTQTSTASGENNRG